MANNKDGKTRAADPYATEIDPKTWRLVTLEVDARGDRGGIDRMQVQELMPLATLSAEHARAGAHSLALRHGRRQRGRRGGKGRVDYGLPQD